MVCILSISSAVFVWTTASDTGSCSRLSFRDFLLLHPLKTLAVMCPHYVFTATPKCVLSKPLAINSLKDMTDLWHQMWLINSVSRKLENPSDLQHSKLRCGVIFKPLGEKKLPAHCEAFQLANAILREISLDLKNKSWLTVEKSTS